MPADELDAILEHFFSTRLGSRPLIKTLATNYDTAVVGKEQSKRLVSWNVSSSNGRRSASAFVSPTRCPSYCAPAFAMNAAWSAFIFFKPSIGKYTMCPES